MKTTSSSGARLLVVAMLAAAAPSAQEVEEVPRVRVLIVDTTESLEVRCRGAVRLEVEGRRKPVRRWSELPKVEIRREKGAFRLQRLEVARDVITLVTDERPLQSGDREYPQRIHLVASRKGDGFLVVNDVDVETYVTSVTRSEIGAGAPAEALKAQAIAARSYVAAGIEGFPRARKRPPVFDVYADTRSQVYKGVLARDPRLERAVAETAAQVLTYQRRILRAYYSASCGGTTRGLAEWTGKGEIPPLAGVACGFCDAVGRGRWEREVALADVAAALEKDLDGAKVTGARISETTKSGRPASVEITCGRRRVEITSARFCEALGIETTWFSIEPKGKRALALAGVGHGHGVGLCQIGAREMARAGADAAAILAHYYPGAEIEAGYRVKAARRRR